MAYQDFYVGQRVRIRDWDDMEKEFGLKPWGAIECEFTFPEYMKYLCGCEATITKIIGTEVILSDWVGKCDGCNLYSYSTDMLEPVEDMPIYEFNSVAFNAMLGIIT